MHKMLIRSPQDDMGDTFGQLILMNAVNGEQYVFDVMKDEELDLEEGELYHSVFLSAVVSNLDLRDKDGALDRILDAGPKLGLDNLLVESEFKQVFQKIIDFELRGIPFFHEVPLAAQRMDLNYLIIEEEITRLIFRVLEDELTKKDVFDFGQLLQLEEILFEMPQLDYLEEPFKKVLMNEVINEVEENYIKKVMCVLQIEF